MNPRAMEPFGRALVAFLNGASDAAILVRRDDGKEEPLPAAHFFRDEDALTLIERTAVALCRGLVLDIGTGAGALALVLQRRGHTVTALDISPEAVAVSRRRGLADVRCADIAGFDGGHFDTLLMMGHGIGMVETLAGIAPFLAHAATLLVPGGQLLVDSLDVRVTRDPVHLAYHEANRRAGRYIGEVRMRFAFGGVEGPECGWLQVDPQTLASAANAAGWRCEVAAQGEHGDYLARLTRPLAP